MEVVLKEWFKGRVVAAVSSVKAGFTESIGHLEEDLSEDIPGVPLKHTNTHKELEVIGVSVCVAMDDVCVRALLAGVCASQPPADHGDVLTYITSARPPRPPLLSGCLLV